MAALTTQSLVAAGTAPTTTTPTVAGDTVEVGNGYNTFAVYRNTTTAKTITLVLSHLNDVSGRTLANKTYALAAPGEVWIPLKKEYANDALNGVGRAQITIDTNVTATVSIVQAG